jgi:hypothetical protein
MRAVSLTMTSRTRKGWYQIKKEAGLKRESKTRTMAMKTLTVL